MVLELEWLWKSSASQHQSDVDDTMNIVEVSTIAIEPTTGMLHCCVRWSNVNATPLQPLLCCTNTKDISHSTRNVMSWKPIVTA